MKKQFLVYIILLCNGILLAQQKITIAVAANMKFAMDSIISVYHKTYPKDKIVVTYGSSGKLYEQIVNDAPFEIFFSADDRYPTLLVEKKFNFTSPKVYAIGKLILWSKKINLSKENIQVLLKSDISKIAIANPKNAPYGKGAEEAMRYYKVYDKIKSKLVFGEDVSQAAQFVITGAADIGIVALSLALSPKIKQENGYYYIIPQDSYTPLKQTYVILKKCVNLEMAKRFCLFIDSPSAKKILSYYGFSEK